MPPFARSFPLKVSVFAACAGLMPLASFAQQSAADASAPAAEQSAFDVLEYRVLGNSTLPAVEVERAVYPFLGPGKTFGDVESARQNLETAYRAAGYATVFVDIPEQQVDEGIVRLRVTEGRVDRVRVTGAQYFSNKSIRAAVPGLARGDVPKLAEVQEQLSALNAGSRDRAIVPVLKAGRTPGSVDVELQVEDKLPLHASLELNDRYTADTSRLRLTASFSYDNLFQRQHSLSFQYQTAPEEPSDSRAIVGSYVFRVPTWDQTVFALYAVDSKSDIAALGTLSVLGTGNIFGMRAIRALPAQPDYVHSFTFGLDYKDFLEDIRLEQDEGLVTPIRYIDWSAAYTGTLRTESTMTTFNVGANFGIRGLVNDSDEFADKRFLARPNYVYFRGGVQHLLRLPLHMQAFVRVSGQFAVSPLVSNEQFIIGGADTVRGYLESSHLGDYGATETFELRNDWLSQLLQMPAGSAYVMAFVDAGQVAVLEPLPSQVSRYSLASWGLGLRIGGWHGAELAVDFARALRDSSSVRAGEDRAHFTFRYAF
jgi:hemolysin activation/secretion protein